MSILREEDALMETKIESVPANHVAEFRCDALVLKLRNKVCTTCVLRRQLYNAAVNFAKRT